jgi:nucleotide-binding universal stress UspA family protein
VVETKSAIRTGLASHEILEAAKELDVDLIVIATHGFSGWKHFCIGSTAERVARSAPCPVLVVREKEHEFI